MANVSYKLYHIRYDYQSIVKRHLLFTVDAFKYHIRVIVFLIRNEISSIVPSFQSNKICPFSTNLPSINTTVALDIPSSPYHVYISDRILPSLS